MSRGQGHLHTSPERAGKRAGSHVRTRVSVRLFLHGMTDARMRASERAAFLLLLGWFQRALIIRLRDEKDGGREERRRGEEETGEYSNGGLERSRPDLNGGIFSYGKIFAIVGNWICLYTTDRTRSRRIHWARGGREGLRYPCVCPR